MTARAARTTEAMTERQLQDCIVQAARVLGYLVHHQPDSRRSEPGYPDLTIVHPETGALLVIECKTARGRLRGPSVAKKSGRVLPGQAEWIAAFLRAGAGAVIARPADLDDVIEALKQGAGKV
jgi:hypothetical protein